MTTEWYPFVKFLARDRCFLFYILMVVGSAKFLPRKIFLFIATPPPTPPIYNDRSLTARHSVTVVSQRTCQNSPLVLFIRNVHMVISLIFLFFFFLRSLFVPLQFALRPLQTWLQFKCIDYILLRLQDVSLIDVLLICVRACITNHIALCCSHDNNGYLVKYID